MPTNTTQFQPNWKLLAACAVGAAMLGLGLLVPRQTFSSESATMDGPSLAAMMLRLAIVSAVVCSLCAGVTWLIIVLRRGTTVKTAGGDLKVIDALNIGRGCRVHLVRAGDAWMLVGIDATGLKSLLPLKADEEAVADLAKAA